MDIVLVNIVLIVDARSAVMFHATDEKTVSRNSIRDERNVALRIHIFSLLTVDSIDGVIHCRVSPDAVGMRSYRDSAQSNFISFRRFDIKEHIDKCYPEN